MTDSTTPAKSTRNPVYRFHTRRVAESFRAHSVRPMWLMLGDHEGEDGVYLVACPADCQRLARAGYEYA